MHKITGDNPVMATHHIDGFTAIALLKFTAADVKIINTGHLQAVVIAAAADIPECHVSHHDMVSRSGIISSIIDVYAVHASILEGKPLDDNVA